MLTRQLLWGGAEKVFPPLVDPNKSLSLQTELSSRTFNLTLSAIFSTNEALSLNVDRALRVVTSALIQVGQVTRDIEAHYSSTTRARKYESSHHGLIRFLPSHLFSALGYDAHRELIFK